MKIKTNWAGYACTLFLEDFLTQTITQSEEQCLHYYDNEHTPLHPTTFKVVDSTEVYNGCLGVDRRGHGEEKVAI